MARAKLKLRRRTIDLYEDIVRGQRKLRVDREKGIVYGVKVLGLESVNGRRYLPEAIRDAVGLYEGIGVYENHPRQPNDPRACNDRFGWLENVQVGEGGALYGDLHILLPESELAKKVFKAAEEKPDLFGLSHNAKGEGENDTDGIFVVRKIVDLRSVDVVTEPATTGGLLEQRGKRVMAIKIKALFENSWKKYAAKCKKRPKLAARMKRLVEDDAYGVMDDDAPADVAEVPADHEEALKDGFEASVSAIVKQCLDGEEEPGECIKKIAELLKAHDKLAGGDDAEEDDVEEEEEEPGKKPPEDEDKKETEEQRRLKQLERKDKARDLCEDMGIVCDKVLLEALTALPDERAMKRLLEREKGKPAGGKGNPPRSGATGGSGKQTQATLEGVDTPEGCLAALLG